MTKTTQSNYRFFISVLFRILVLVGFVAVISPFVLSVIDKTETANSPNNQYLTVKLSNMNPGDVKKITVTTIPVWIYKRHKNEIEQLSHMTAFLIDPFSTLSVQPEQLRNHYRSYNIHYFVFKPIESIRSCTIRFLENPDTQLRVLLFRENLTWLGGFTESCFGSVYDLSGRRYKLTGNKKQQNLSIPNYSINFTKQQGDVIQFDLRNITVN